MQCAVLPCPWRVPGACCPQATAGAGDRAWKFQRPTGFATCEAPSVRRSVVLILWLDTRKGGGPSSIFTISVDASGRRLASAGLDSTIRVWNLDALTNAAAPKLLAAMTRHDGTRPAWSRPCISG